MNDVYEPRTWMRLAALAGLVLLAAPNMALAAGPLAYIGPGAGLGAISALLAVLAAIAVGLLGLLMYPFQLLRRRLRGGAKAGAGRSPE